MNESSARLLALRDEALPALPAILGTEAQDVLAAAVELSGGRILSVRLSQVSWAPGRSITAVFETELALKDAAATREQFVASTAVTPPAGGMQLEDASGARIAVWRLQDDPKLPGLTVAMDPRAARGLLDSLDVAPGPVSARLRAYRPTRRAVVELVAGRQRVFVKVVPPPQVRRLQSLHAGISPHLPVPRTHGWSEQDGLVVLQAMPGLSLRKCLLDRRLALPDPTTIMALLDCIPTPPDGRTASSQATAALAHAPLLRALAPDCESLIDTLVEELLEAGTAAPVVPVHGDLHEAQITVLSGKVAGLLDIDTAGMGERGDDWATLLGHLAVLREEAPPATRHRIQSYAARLMAVADQDVAEPTRLRKRVAAVIFGLASGPFRVQSSAWLDRTRSRLRLAEVWLQNARRHAKDESVLSRA